MFHNIMSEINKFIGHYISGKHYVDNGEKIDILNPCNNELIGILSSATEKTVKKAVDEAEKAFKSWKNTPVSKEFQFCLTIKIC